MACTNVVKCSKSSDHNAYLGIVAEFVDHPQSLCWKSPHLPGRDYSTAEAQASLDDYLACPRNHAARTKLTLSFVPAIHLKAGRVLFRQHRAANDRNRDAGGADLFSVGLEVCATIVHSLPMLHVCLTADDGGVGAFLSEEQRNDVSRLLIWTADRTLRPTLRKLARDEEVPFGSLFDAYREQSHLDSDSFVKIEDVTDLVLRIAGGEMRTYLRHTYHHRCESLNSHLKKKDPNEDVNDEEVTPRRLTLGVTPDRIVEGIEQITQAIKQCCTDQFDCALLAMTIDGHFSQLEMGLRLGIGRARVQRDLTRIQRALATSLNRPMKKLKRSRKARLATCYEDDVFTADLAQQPMTEEKAADFARRLALRFGFALIGQYAPTHSLSSKNAA